MSPIRILRWHRHRKQEKLLRDIAEKLREFVPSPPPVYGPILDDRCVGCGKLGTSMCRYCSEIQGWTLRRIQKLQSTLQVKFAARI